jgi:predicted Zn finger-like uncharacterized protein
MKIVCDACQAKYSIADDKIQGKAFKIRCKKCNHIIVVKTGAGTGGGDVVTAAPVAEKSKSGATPVAAQGVWHIVVDGDQVGPMTETEVKDRLRQGQINAETLVWKEGLADWVKLSTISEFASAGSKAVAVKVAASQSTGQPDRSSSPARAEAVAASPSAGGDADADVFGAATVITPAGTADLFAAGAASTAVPAAVAPAPSSPFLFGGSPSQPSEPVMTKSPGNGAGHSHLTAQRNENSVLFSLSNLEALAVPSQSGGIRPPSSTGTTEGSGLIDIRSMAAMTLGEGGTVDARRSADSLPTFSTPQFSPVAPVLLPMSSSGPPKWVYPVLGLLGVGVLVLGYGIYKIVAAPPPGTPPAVVAPAPAPVAQPTAANQAPAVAPGAEVAKPVKAEGKPEDKPAAVEDKPAEKGKGGVASKGDKHRKSTEQASASKGSSESKKGSEAAATEPTAAGAKANGKKGAKSLDDLLGEVGNKKGGGDEGGKPKPAPVALVSLTQSDIVNAMKGVQPRVQACANQFKVPGTAMATISVSAGGKVGSAAVTGKFAGTPTGTCVEAAAKSAKFPACNSMTFPWPFTLSPR